MTAQSSSPSSLDALLDGVLKRLAPLVKPFHDSKSGGFKTTTALDTALVWTFKWTRGLRKGRNTFNEVLFLDFAKSLRHVLFAWTVEHPKLFSSSDVDPAFLRSHHLEKEKIETIVQATKQFMHVVMHEAVSEAAILNPGKGGKGATAVVDDTRWRDPRAGWQGVLLGLLEGLCHHLETRNPASAPNSQNDLSAYRDYIGVELVQGLVDIVFPSKVGNPTGPGDPIKDYKGRPVLAPEIKSAALDVLVESLRRQVATASALRKLLTFETMGTVLRSGYDVHLSALMIDIAYRLLPGRRKSSTTQAMSKRFVAMEALFPEEVYGRNEADDLRKLFDALDKGDWREQSTEILHRISVQHIKRAQAFSVHDFRSDGAHLLPVARGREGHHYESLTATDVISQKIFVPTPVWFGRDSLTVLIDEPPEMTQRRMLEEKGTPDIGPASGHPAAVDETRDARAVVHYSAIHKLYVRRLDAAKDDYRITILFDNSLQIDGRPHTSDKEASHHGLEIDSAPAPLAGKQKAYHKLELLVAAEKANLGLLKKVLQDRMQLYPRLGAELGNFPAIPPSPAGKGNSFATPAPKAAAKPSADAQTSSTTAAKAGCGGMSKSSAAGPARAEVPNEVAQAPLRTSQAGGLQFTEPRRESEVDQADGTGAEGAKGKVVVKGDGAPTREADLERRRDELEAMARESSPAKSAASTRRRSKETEQDAAAETGDLLETYDYNNHDFGGGFEDEEARGAAFDAEISSRKEDQSEEEEEMLSPSRLGRGGGHRQRSASPQLEPDQLDYNAGKVDSAKSKKSKQPPPAPASDDDDDNGKAGKAKKPRQAKSPAPTKSAPPRRSARLSPPPAKPQDEKAKPRSSRSGLQDAAGKEEEASDSEPEEQSRSRRGAAQNKKKKQVVQPTAKQKRRRQDEEDEDEDERETMSSLSESSDEADGLANRRKKTKARVPASKRRKVDKEAADKGDETDYEEQYSLPTKDQRRSDIRKFGKTVAPLKGNGITRKANQPGPKAAAKGKPGSRAENKPGSKGSSERGSKAGKKGPTRPTGKIVAGAHESASEMSTEDVEGRVPAQSTRASRSKAKKVVAAVSADGAASSEEEERSPKKKGDKRIADDIPPPADLTASEQLRVQRAGIRSPAISPAKPKPVQTLDQLTGNAPVPIEEPAEVVQAMDITQDGEEEQQEIFEADFDFDVAVADVAEIEAVFGPTPAETTSEAAIKTRAPQKDIPAPPLPSKNVETAPRVLPQTDDSASAVKPSTAGGEVPSAVAVPSPVPTVLPKERPSVAAALAPAEEDASASTSVPPEKPVRQVGGAEVPPAPAPAPASVSAVAASSNAAPVEKQPQRALPSDPLPKPGPARGHVGAPFDDSGVQFVANDTDVIRPHKKGGTAADSRRPVADSMDLDADEHNNTEAGAKSDTPTSATPAVIPSPASHGATGLAGPTEAADQHRGEAVHASRAAPRQQDIRPLQSTPARHAAAKQRPPESFMPWSAIPTRTAALRQGTSRPVKPPIPADVRQKAQSATAAASNQKKSHANRPAARNSQQKTASPGQPAPAGAGRRGPPVPSRMPGSRPRNETDKIVLEERPLDCYEEFFDLLVDMGRVLVKKQQEKAADLQERRKAGTQKVEKLVARSAQRDNAETREISRMVVQRAAALDHNGASPSLQACAQDVGDNCAVLGDEVRELLRKLAAEKVA